MSTADDEKVFAALSQAYKQLKIAMREQETAANRILGLAERVQANAKDQATALQADGIIEACAFEDITGQRLKKVARLVKHLRDKKLIAISDMPRAHVDKKPATSLSQSDVDSLLAGTPFKPR
jgi:chemotaxis regulatin CheY-phosphate phosphatase CheZ